MLIARLATAVAVFLVALPVFADSSIDHWSAGNAAFARGDYEEALESFEQARIGGVTGPAVHYNIAVCQYKLSRYAEAGNTFTRIGRDYPKMAGLAEYNLGLVARKRGDKQAATEHFLSAYRLSPDDETLRILASNRLAEFEVETPSARRIRGALGARAGYDDNVALRDTDVIPTGTTTESPMLDVFASASGPVLSRVENLSFDANLYAVRYFDADEFDQEGIGAGLSWSWQAAGWQMAAGPQAGIGRLGGDAFDRRIGLRASARRPLEDGATLRLSYVFDDVSEGDELFDGIDGTRHLLEARYDRRLANGHRLDVRLRYESNDREDAGVSPTRTGLSVDYGLPLDADWTLDAGIELRRSRFDELATPRDEDLLTLKASLLRRLSQDWSLFADLRISDNDADDPVFSYDRNAITIGAMRSF